MSKSQLFSLKTLRTGYELVGQGYCDDSEERRDGVSNVVPVDLANVSNHERTNDHESTSSSPGRDAGKDGGEEDRDEKGKPGRDRREASLPTLCNPPTSLSPLVLF